MSLLNSKKDDVFSRLQQENERLKKSIQELSILNELSSVISSTMSLNKIMDKVVSASVKAINAEQGTIHLLDKDTEAADPFKTLIRKADETTPKSKYRLDVELSGWMIKNRQPLRINDFDNNKQFINRQTGDLKIRTLLSVPLVCKGELIGVLNLYNKKGDGEFSNNDQRLLSIIASQSAQVLENARLYEQEKDFLQIAQELEMARSIQIKLLPKDSPEIAGFDIAGASYAAKDVGGDYFDFIELDSGRWCIALGDVSGKGIPASLLMSYLQATIRNQAVSNTTIVDCISKANDVLCRNTEANKFVTLFGGVLDPHTKTFNYINAGHNFPYHVKHNGELEELKVGGLIMGMLPSCLYEDDTIQLEPGDLIVMYSDGVTEAENELEDMYGEKRLRELIVKNRELSARGLVDQIYNEVKNFEGQTSRADDITLVALRAL